MASLSCSPTSQRPSTELRFYSEDTFMFKKPVGNNRALWYGTLFSCKQPEDVHCGYKGMHMICKKSQVDCEIGPKCAKKISPDQQQPWMQDGSMLSCCFQLILTHPNVAAKIVFLFYSPILRSHANCSHTFLVLSKQEWQLAGSFYSCNPSYYVYHIRRWPSAYFGFKPYRKC